MKLTADCKYLYNSYTFYYCLVMKQKICVSIDENCLLKIRGALRGGKYRNRSHIIEYAVERLLEVDG